MNTDDFEQKLQRQTPRRIPSEWRAEILDAALKEASCRVKSSTKRQALFPKLNEMISALLWPHPKAWAGLAAVWTVIWAMSFYSADQTITVVKHEVPPSPEFMIALREQRRELARLVEPSLAADAERPKLFRPSPRSERGGEMLAV